MNRFIRVVPIIAFICLLNASNSQMKMEANVVVKKHRVGADLVEITILKPHFSQETLKSLAHDIGKYTRSASRGVQIYQEQVPTGQNGLRFLKASFATDGIINGEKRFFQLNPIVKAFSVLKEPNQLSRIHVHFPQFAPHENTLKEFRSQAVTVLGKYYQKPAGIEYEIEILQNNPSLVNIPLSVSKSVKKNKSTQKNNFREIFFISMLSVCAGCLVYVFFLKFVHNSKKTEKASR